MTKGSPGAAKAEQVCMAQAVVAHVYGVRLDELQGPGRGGKVAHARQVAMYLAHTVLRMRMPDVARAFGRDPSTTRYACRRVEELREDADVDRTLSWLETLLRGAAGLEGAVR